MALTDFPAPDRLYHSSGQDVWITNGSGGVLSSRDYGDSWLDVGRTLPGARLAAVRVFDRQNIWAAGDLAGKAVIVSTVDGGVTWRIQNALPLRGTSAFTDIKFYDHDFGVAVGGGEFGEFSARLHELCAHSW